MLMMLTYQAPEFPLASLSNPDLLLDDFKWGGGGIQKNFYLLLLFSPIPFYYFIDYCTNSLLTCLKVQLFLSQRGLQPAPLTVYLRPDHIGWHQRGWSKRENISFWEIFQNM